MRPPLAYTRHLLLLLFVFTRSIYFMLFLLLVWLSHPPMIGWVRPGPFFLQLLSRERAKLSSNLGCDARVASFFHAEMWTRHSRVIVDEFTPQLAQRWTVTGGSPDVTCWHCCAVVARNGNNRNTYQTAKNKRPESSCWRQRNPSTTVDVWHRGMRRLSIGASRW